MKRHCSRQVSFIVLIGIVMFSAAAVYGAEESIVLTTYYPSPYGVYGEMRLYPKASATCNSQQEGLMYYDNDPPSERGLRICVCKNPPCPPGGFDWMSATGYWAASPFNSNNIYNTNSGNVGIGTNNPAAKFQITSPNPAIGSFYFGAALGPPGPGGSSGDISFDGGTGSQFYFNNFGPDSTGETGFLYRNNPILIMKNSGDIGIGTADPLQLKLYLNANTPTPAGRNGMQISTPLGHYVSLGGGIGTDGSNSAGLHIGNQAGNNIGGEGGTLYYDYDAPDRSLVAASTGGIRIAALGQYPPAGRDIIFATNPTNIERMRITNSGNVGIGTANPLYNLDVVSSSSLGVLLVREPAANLQNNNARFAAIGFGTGIGGNSQAGVVIGVPGKSWDLIVDSSAGNSFGVVEYIGGNSWIHRLNVRPGGNVGIGLTNPSYQLELSLDSAAKPNGGDWAAVSDERLKTNIKPLAGALEKVTALKGVQFEWRNPEEHASGAGEIRAGFIAQDVEKVFPQFINEIDASGKDKALTPDGKIESLSLPIDFNAYLVEAIKELKEENDALKARIEALEKK